MKKLYLLLAVLFFNIVFSQVEKKDMISGEITLTNNQKIEFKNLTWKKDKAYYYNVSTQENEELYDASIKSVIEKELTPQKPADKLYRPEEYPAGIYVTKEDFINKTPSLSKDLTKKELYGFEKKIASDSEMTVFFFDNDKKTKLKDVFAVSHNGILYFNLESILKNRNKTDRAQGTDNPNAFVRVVFGGSNYLYTEATLANVWAKGFAYGAVSGAAGGALANSMDTTKGIVWDFKNQEFNIFKNCLDYNEFIKDKSPKDYQKCEQQQADILKIREAINQIK